MLLRAFEGLRAVGVDARLTVAGATREEVQPFLLDAGGHRHRRPRHRGREVVAARAGRPALRAVARRRELRHGADRGVRVRHAGRLLRHRGLPRRRPRRRSTAVLVPPGDPTALGEALHELGERPRAARRDARARARARRAVRVAARGGRARVAVRGGGRRPEPPSAAQRLAVRDRACAAPTSARALPPAGFLRSSRPIRAPAAATRSASPRRAAVVGCAALGVGLTALALDHIGLKPIGNALLAATPGVGARRVRADVRVDADPRRGVARRPAGGASERAGAPTRRRARDDDRGADVGHAARAARRAVARADRRAAPRTRARAAPGGARHARRADVPEPRRRS